MAVVPIKMFLTGRGFLKVEIGLGKGKKTHDKRESLKGKEAKRDIARAKNERY